MAEGSRQPIRPDQIALATGQKPRARLNPDGTYTVSGVSTSTWFGPLQPMAPQAQSEDLGAIGRRFDYLVGTNLSYTPRASEGIGFGMLRALADNLDILRLIIETRKDQMEALEWAIRPIDKSLDADTKSVLEFLRYPDRSQPYGDWMRMLLEELFVTDALCLYPRPTNGGALWAVEPVDGATIKVLLDAQGRTPVPPSAAYQQVLKGIPAANYRAASGEPGGEIPELIYRPRNRRVWKAYGYSPVEQLIVTVDIALRRQLFQRDYYTEGSVPDAFGMLPENWTPAMIAEFQKHWDSLFENLAGENNAQRRKMRWVPGAKDIKFAKDAILKDEFDEWLARICCYCFSVEPTPFVKMTNRATAETQKEQSRTEGLLPLKKWWKGLMDFIVQVYLKRPDLEFIWSDEESSSPLEKAQVDQIYLQEGVLEANEVRADLGLEPLAKPAAPPNGTTGDPTAAAGKKDGTQVVPPAEKLYKRRRRSGIKPIVHRRRRVIQAEKKLRAVMQSVFTRAAGQLKEAMSKAADDAGAPPDIIAAQAEQQRKEQLRVLVTVIDGLELPILDDEYDEILGAISDVAVDGATEGLAQVGVSADDAFNLANDQATAWAADRAAELINRDAGGGSLTDATRDMLRQTVTTAETEGWSNDRLAGELSDAYAFSADRAETIARTELAMADSNGAMEGYRASGVVEKKAWQRSNNDYDCEICSENEAAGEIGLDETFPSGDDAPPAHPNGVLGDTRVAAFGISRYYKRRFHGEVVRIATKSGHDLTVTPNHPILTARGFVAAQDLQFGDQAVIAGNVEAAVLAAAPDDHYMPAVIEEVTNALLVTRGVASRRVPTAAVDFHGDGIPDGDVDVVGPAGELVTDSEAAGDQDLAEIALVLGQQRRLALNAHCASPKLIGAPPASSSGGIGGSDLRGSPLRRPSGADHGLGLASGADVEARILPCPPQAGVVDAHLRGEADAALSGEVAGMGGADALVVEHPQQRVALGGTADHRAALAEDSVHDLGCHAQRRRDRVDRLAGLVTLDEIVDIRRQEFDGHVYNLTTAGGWYFANGIVTHNCECVVIPVVDDAEKSARAHAHTLEKFVASHAEMFAKAVQSMPAPIVNIAPAAVTVNQAPVEVTVQPAEAQVVVELPARRVEKTTTVTKRDERGLIVEQVTVEQEKPQ